jgi:predicted PolB exonuclease-like 3'-5' exonuclease
VADAIASLASITEEGGPLRAFAVLRRPIEGRTAEGSPFLDLELADRSACLRAKIWGDAPEAMAAARALPAGTAVKIEFEARTYRGALQLTVKRLREAATGDAGYDPDRLFGPGFALAQGLACKALVVDIETVPSVDLRRVPPTIAAAVTKAAERMESEEGKVMSLSPFFGQVVSLAVADADAPHDPRELPVTVFCVPPPGRPPGTLPPWVRLLDEKEVLEVFWALASLADVVVTFNGFNFDVPYLMCRSLVHDVPACRNLLGSPFAYRPHCDLYRVITQGSRSLGPATLDVICWALQIESPKSEMDGAMVAPAYRAGEIEKIAAYNAADVRATVAVYRRVREQILRFS